MGVWNKCYEEIHHDYGEEVGAGDPHVDLSTVIGIGIEISKSDLELGHEGGEKVALILVLDLVLKISTENKGYQNHPQNSHEPPNRETALHNQINHGSEGPPES